jgi:hypothetical protein
VKAKGLIAFGIMAMSQGLYELAHTKMEEVIPIERELGDKFWLAFALNTSANMLFFTEDALEQHAMLLRAMLDESEAIYTSIGQRRWVAGLMFVRAALAVRNGNPDARAGYHAEARRLLRDVSHPFLVPTLMGLGLDARLARDEQSARFYYGEGYKIAQRLKSKLLMATTRSELAHLARAMGNLKEAEEGYKQMTLVWKDVGNLAAVANLFECLAFVARADNNLPRAARLLGAAEALRKVVNVPMRAYERVEYEREVAALHEHLEKATFDAAWAEGSAMDVDQAITYARGST